MKKTDDKIQKLNFDDEFLLDSVERRLQSGEYMSALTLLNKRNEMYDASADAFALGADIYEALELWQLAANCWFTFLDTCNEADFAEGYEGLAVCFMNMGEDMPSALYFHEVYGGEEFKTMFEERKKPKLRIVHSDDRADTDGALLERGLSFLQLGELEKAKELFSEVSEENADHASAAGLSAMCTLMLGDEEEAEKMCEALLEKYPDNIMALTTYCAVLQSRGNTEGAKEAARRLVTNPSQKTEDLFRIATALCETGLDEEAYGKLTELMKRIPYDDTAVYLYAVSAYRSGRLQEAISALEKLTTIYPHKAVAKYYLVRMRAVADGAEKFKMNYFYRVPKDKYREIADFLLAAGNAEGNELAFIQGLPDLNDFFEIAFDEMDGRDEKLQRLAVKVALKTRSDAFLRRVLLDATVDDMVKITIMHGLVMRNEENSFGTVFLNVYREFFTHEIEVDRRRGKTFLTAFADVYSKFAFMHEDNEQRIIFAAEDIYNTLCEAGASDYFGERASLAAAIYREARIPFSEHNFDNLCKIFDANKYIVEAILDFMM